MRAGVAPFAARNRYCAVLSSTLGHLIVAGKPSLSQAAEAIRLAYTVAIVGTPAPN